MSIYFKCCEISLQVLFPSFPAVTTGVGTGHSLPRTCNRVSHLQFVNLLLGTSLPPLQEAHEGNSGPRFMLGCRFLCRRKGSAILTATSLCLVVPCRNRLLLCRGSLERPSQHAPTPPLLQPSHQPRLPGWPPQVTQQLGEGTSPPGTEAN